MARRFVLALVALAGAVALSPDEASAQIRASERGSVSQTIDGTTITLDYGRPQVRGRTGLFGGEIWYGKVWTPGANWATTIATNKDIAINGHTLPRGHYSVWLHVQGGDEWTAIFDPVPRRFHLMPPEPSEDQVRFAVSPGTGPHTEILTFSFAEVRPTGATLRLGWATTTVDFDISVPPSRDLTVAPDFAERYVGEYTLERMAFLGTGEVPFNITYGDEHLIAHWPSAPNPNLQQFWLISLGERMFAPGELHEGELFDIVMDVIFEFSPYEGRATGFELRALGDELWGKAEKR